MLKVVVSLSIFLASIFSNYGGLLTLLGLYSKYNKQYKGGWLKEAVVVVFLLPNIPDTS